MGLDLRLVILDSDRRAVVVDRWLGRRTAYERVLARLARPPDTVRPSEANWRVRPDEVVASAESFYASGPTRAEVVAWVGRFDEARFVWWVVADW